MSDSDDPLWWGQPADARRYHIFEGAGISRSLCGNWLFKRRQEEEIGDDAEYRQGEDCKACCRKAGVLDDD